MDSTTTTNSGPWKSPQLATYLFIYLFVGLIVDPSRTLLGDLDVCWLIRTGELIWQTGHLPTTDVFSFTHQGKPWILYQWGFELFIGALHLIAGLGGVVWGGALLVSLTYATLFYFLLQLCINRWLSIALIALVMKINSFNWLSRPNTVSVLFYVFLLLLLENYRKSPSRRIWYLPLLFILWANVHLGFISGLMVLILYAFWCHFSPNDFWANKKQNDNRLITILIFCILATFINPYGHHLFVYLWDLSMASTMNANILELQSPDFHSYVHFTLIILLVLLLWSGAFKYHGRKVFLSLSSITLVMALYSARHIPYFSIPAIIHIAYTWLAHKNQTTDVCIPRFDQCDGWGWGVIIAVLSLIIIVSISNLRPEFYNFNNKLIPEKAVAYLNKKEDIGPQPFRVFTSANGAQWNDYLLYKLYPKVRVFIDTRFDMYGETFFKKYLLLVENLQCDLKSIESFKVDFLIFDKTKEQKSQKIEGIHPITPLGPPPASPPWKLVYEDEKSVIYKNLDNVCEK